MNSNEHLWCDQAKWVLCRALSNCSFVVHFWKHSESFVLLKTSSKLDLWFQRYRQFWVTENNKIQKEFRTIIGYRISQNQYSRHTTHSTWSPHILWGGHWERVKRLKKSVHFTWMDNGFIDLHERMAIKCWMHNTQPRLALSLHGILIGKHLLDLGDFGPYKCTKNSKLWVDAGENILSVPKMVPH